MRTRDVQLTFFVGRVFCLTIQYHSLVVLKDSYKLATSWCVVNTSTLLGMLWAPKQKFYVWTRFAVEVELFFKLLFQRLNIL